MITEPTGKTTPTAKTVSATVFSAGGRDMR